MYKSVEMLFTSDIDGNLKPIRFRMHLGEEYLVVPVKNPIVTEKNKLPGSHFIYYRAEFIINDYLKPGILRYNGRDHIWEIMNK